MRIHSVSCLIFLPFLNINADVYRQTPEVQKSIERGTALETPKEDQASVTEAQFSSGPVPEWIWGKDNNRDYKLTTQFQLPSGVTAAVLKASCDNEGTVFVNGTRVTAGAAWEEPMSADVTQHLVEGDNTISAKVANRGGVAAFVLKLAVQTADEKMTYVVTNGDWMIESRNGDTQNHVAIRGRYGDGPWGAVFSNTTAYAGRVPRGVFEVLPGFQVEKLFTVPKDELGSWVCIAFDNKGRLLASDQGDKGICRITLPAVSSGTPGETIVERLDFSNCEFQPTGAHGMLYAFDSLYFSVNGGPGSGLYRARDTDDDDQFDECVKLKDLRGGGEHGPHSLRLSPDGKRIFLIAGNHTDPPFQPGDELTSDDYSSRIPTNWGEDLLLPRMWDANGHARGKLAPGGWIASTDPDGKTWDLWSVGYRNPYDMAFNADGDLFAYDADMEWDVGTPWYRPTRVVHATSGSEFGWRSGTGKWPTYYFDSLPPLTDIGPGSPVGVDFGYGLKFPAKYQKALYICDWTFGTMYAIHTEPHFSSYTATKQEFVSRSALPLTDVAAGPDGALYFTVGGRGTQSELYRVSFVGKEDVSPTNLKMEEVTPFQRSRRFVERFHGRPFDLFHMIAELNKLRETGETVNPKDMGKDPFLMSAVRRLVQSPTVAEFVVDSLKNVDSRSTHTTEIVLAMVRGVGRNGLSADTIRQPAIDALRTLKFPQLSAQVRLDYLRALSLIFIRLGEPTAEEQADFRNLLDSEFPQKDPRVNRELCQMLVYLNSDSVVAKTVDLMNAAPQRQDIDMTDLLARNAGYGRAISAMIANQPDTQQMWYAFCLRVATAGWTPELRADYYRWFGRAQSWSGGNSFRKFLQNIEDEAWEKTPFDHRVLVENAGARTPYRAPELPKPTGPGREWTLDEVRALAGSSLTGRSFANGQKMFSATRCILCHRFVGDGGATGPDLTQLAGRFNLDALTEAIMDPGKVISDQYAASSVVTVDGKTINGRIVSDNDQQISVLTDPEDSTKVIDIPRGDIEEIVASKTSIMPANLLNTLNQDEVLDLLAYLLSRGDEKNAMFQKQ